MWFAHIDVFESDDSMGTVNYGGSLFLVEKLDARVPGQIVEQDCLQPELDCFPPHR